LVLLRRIQHWCINQGINSASQIGFKPVFGAETHVYTALETLSLARRQRLHVALCLFDIKGAFDNVYRKALWRILRKIGMPDQLVTLLENWYAHRSLAVKVGKEVSHSFPLSKGLTQGDVLSPLLWNSFFESLLRMLEARVDGVTHSGGPQSVTLKTLAYADDLAAFCSGKNAAQVAKRAQQALDIVLEWSRNWGIKINTKPGKTEAMYFSPTFRAGQDTAPFGSRGTNAGFQPLDAGRSPDGAEALQVHWVDSYKYLGFPLTLSLDTSAYLEKRVRMLELCFTRFFFFFFFEMNVQRIQTD
jgi:Reverse transcriptase (RNA-dependent DNA polymerase)